MFFQRPNQIEWTTDPSICEGPVLVAKDCMSQRPLDQDLSHYEAIIERGMQTFVEVGNALLAIRDGRLYETAGYKTFEQYCSQRWAFTANRANDYIRSARVMAQLGSATSGEDQRAGSIVLPTSERQVAPLAKLEPAQQVEAWERAVETAPDGKITGAHVRQVVNEMLAVSEDALPPAACGIVRCPTCQNLYDGDTFPTGCPYCYKDSHGLQGWVEDLPDRIKKASQPIQVMVFSSETDEYYTPPAYIEAAREVMGGIDLDPASCETAQGWIKAKTFYAAADDGLCQPWQGRVWLNPPYGKTGNTGNQEIWAAYLVEQYRAGSVKEAILLVRAALGYNWFEDLWYNWPVCFAKERLSFIKADGTNDGQSKQGTAFLYFGPNVERFKTVFGRFGRVILPEDGYTAL